MKRVAMVLGYRGSSQVCHYYGKLLKQEIVMKKIIVLGLFLVSVGLHAQGVILNNYEAWSKNPSLSVNRIDSFQDIDQVMAEITSIQKEYKLNQVYPIYFEPNIISGILKHLPDGFQEDYIDFCIQYIRKERYIFPGFREDLMPYPKDLWMCSFTTKSTQDVGSYVIFVWYKNRHSYDCFLFKR